MEAVINTRIKLAGETGLEPATNGFGDRYSTIEPLPCTNTYCTRKPPTPLAEISTASKKLKNSRYFPYNLLQKIRRTAYTGYEYF